MFKSESKKSYHYFVDCNVAVESEEVDVSSFRSVKQKTKLDNYLPVTTAYECPRESRTIPKNI